MRGFYADPRRVNTMKGEGGWAARQAAALEKMNGNAAWREIDADRQTMIAEKEQAGRAEAETRRAANARLRVSCPCCDSGAVSVEKAELILAALDRAPVNEDRRLQAIQEKDTQTCPVCDSGTVDSELHGRVVESLSRMPANRDIDYSRIGNLIAVAKGETFNGPDAIRPRNGAKAPRRAPAVADPVAPLAAVSPDPMEGTETAQTLMPSRRFVPPPFLADD